MIGSFVRFLLLTRSEGSLNSLVRFAHSFVYAILHNSWIKIVRTHQPWSNLYVIIIEYYDSTQTVRLCVQVSRNPFHLQWNPIRCTQSEYL